MEANGRNMWEIKQLGIVQSLWLLNVQLVGMTYICMSVRSISLHYDDLYHSYFPPPFIALFFGLHNLFNIFVDKS